MKIAMLSSDYLPNIGGIASHIYELSKALIAQGHEVEVWFWDRKNENPDTSAMGDIPVRRLDDGDIIKKSFKIARHLAHSIDVCLQDFPADILHLHTMDPLLLSTRYLSKKYNGKIVWTNHSSRFSRMTSGSFFWRLKMKYYTSAIDGLLAPSQERLETANFLKVKKSMSIANGVDVENFLGVNKSKAREALKIDKDLFVILYAGRFAPVKGVTFLAKSLVTLNKTTDNFLCIMCGDMPEDRESQTVKDILEQGEALSCARFEGFIPNQKLNTYLSACDILVLPSLMEGTSVSILEAMAASRPIVATEVGGTPELVTDGDNGFLVNPGDSESLVDGLLRAKNHGQLTLLGEQGNKKVISNFTWKKTAQTMLHFYELC